MGMDPGQGRGIDLQNFRHVSITLHLEALAVALLGLIVGLAQEVESASMGVEEHSTCSQQDATYMAKVGIWELSGGGT